MKKNSEDTYSLRRYEDIQFVDSTKPVWNYSLFLEEDIRNFQNGKYEINIHLPPLAGIELK
jgi:hypothetical protein